MKRALRRTLSGSATTLILLATAACAAAPEGGLQLSPETLIGEQFLDDTRRFLDDFEELGFAGVVLLAEHGRAVLTEGYGLADREAGSPWSAETVSTVGSITKQFTGAAILLLEEQGLLSVQDPITRHIDNVPADKQMITLHQLLTHTAGITEPKGLGDWDEITRDEFIRRAMEQPLAFRPGEKYRYSNAGYSLLGAIVEQLSDGSYERFVREHLFVPNDMNETGYLLPRWEQGRFAQGYRQGDLWGTVLGRPLADDGPYWALRANGGIHTTAPDMLRWSQALMEQRVLSETSMAKYWARHADEGGGESYYGYGWVILTGPGEREVVTHNGGNGIFFADIALIPEDNLVMFLQTNVDSEVRRISRILTLIQARLFEGQPYPPPRSLVEGQ